MKKTYKSEISAAIHETASGLYQIGLMSEDDMRELDALCLAPVEKLAPEQIRAVREQSNASPIVFARHLNVTPKLIEQWESGQRKPTGPALKLRHLVKNKGLDCLV